MTRVRLALNVHDLEAAVDFYSRLFGADPSWRGPGAADFEVSDPPLTLVLLEGVGAAGTLHHLGVEVASYRAVDAAERRLAAEGLVVADDEPAAGLQVRAPDGEAWLVFATAGALVPVQARDPQRARRSA